MAENEYIEKNDLKKIIKANAWSNPAVPNAVNVIIDRTPAADVVEVRQIEKAKQEILARIDEFIAEYRGISQSYVDYFGGKAEAMEVARRLVNASLIDLCDSCDAKMDGERKCDNE